MVTRDLKANNFEQAKDKILRQANDKDLDLTTVYEVPFNFNN